MKKNVAEFLEFRFEKLKLLKRSERGEVWLASSRQSGELVIIKRVALTSLPYDLIKKFSFALPPKVYFCVEDESETVIAEEFIQGETLLEKKFLTESEARKILLQMCDGLKELHAQKIIHRDIKPSNLILQGDKIRLIDFDAARVFKDGKEADTNLLGTKGYAPPEQFGSGQTDQRSDIYSLGVTIKNLLGGNYSGHLKKILDKCTELDPKNRFQSVDELKSALTVKEPRNNKKIAAIILITAGIFFISMPTLNGDENFPKEIIPQVEELSTEKISTPEKISSPAQIAPFKFPEIILPPTEQSPLEIPPLPPPKISSGIIKTQFYLNNAPFNQFEHVNERIKISRAEWLQSQARLRITNDTGGIWQSPTIKFIFGQNWGGNISEIKTLPALASSESAEFVIPFDYQISDRKNTSAYLQIYLNGDESKLDEHYWCVWFDIVD